MIEFSAAFEQLDTELSHALFTHLEELPDEGPECSFLTFLAGGPSPSAFRFVAETKPVQHSPQTEAPLILTIRLHNYAFIQRLRCMKKRKLEASVVGAAFLDSIRCTQHKFADWHELHITDEVLLKQVCSAAPTPSVVNCTCLLLLLSNDARH